MASRLPHGAALLVAGYGRVGAPGLPPPALQTLGQIGETLLATAAPWRIRRLSPAVGDRLTPDRASLKRYLGELTELPVDVVIVAVAGVVTNVLGEPALVTGVHHRELPEDATLPLRWIGERLGACRAGSVLVVLSAQSDDHPSGPEAWLEALRTGHPKHVVAAHDARDDGAALDALLAGLYGNAIDPTTGTITLRSISEHLARSVAGLALQRSFARDTLAGSPPLGGLWDLRLSQLAQASRPTVARRDKGAAPDDLLDAILPGRFRVERVLAKGSFGTVYRARQLAVDRDVAVKVVHAGIDPASEEGRLFIQEIQAVGRLDHANVVRIYQADITPDGRLFFVMELLLGPDLQHIITDEGRLEQRRALELAQQLLGGLGAAHDAGLIHADVKPGNAVVVRGREGERLVLIDFGLARLRPEGRAAESAGGTPAYMAPEQLNAGRVDARSDLFAAALVLVTLLTGWRRRSAEELVPPLGDIADPRLRAVLARALSLDPAERFQTAAELADALAGKAMGPSPSTAVRVPFQHLAPLTEQDRGRLQGRERDVAVLTEHVLYRRAVIYTAPSGTGKTSVLRAGLIPRLEALGARTVYRACRAGGRPLAPAIWPGTSSVAEAIRCWHEQRGGKLVVILDQLEAMLSDGQHGEVGSAGAADDLVSEILAFDRWPDEADVAVVLSVREDFLARVIGWSQHLEEGIPVVRLGPLAPDGARAAISAPLAEARLAIAPDLLDVLVRDLEAAANALAPEMGWGSAAAVYPPHLQLACSVLFEALGPTETVITLAHYRRLGGLDAIVGEYLDRVLETELDADAAAVARDLFLAFVTSAHTRAMRTEQELIDIVGGRHGAERVARTLETLRARGLVVRLRAPGADTGWELIHDSLVPRVLGWIDRRDLARRRAGELVRYHLRRSRADTPSLLNRAELREVAGHPDVVPELEAEWAQRRAGEAWTPARLVARSRQTLRRRDLVLVGATIAVLGAAGVPVSWWMGERDMRMREQTLRDRDIGRFTLELAPFDWDATALAAVPVRVATLPKLDWRLHEPDADDPDAPGKEMPEHLVTRRASAVGAEGVTRIDQVEARGGKAFLVITGRASDSAECGPSILPLRAVPGYAQRGQAKNVLRVRVPTCQATRADMIFVEAGRFVRGGVGDPPSEFMAAYEHEAREEIVDLPAFWIDRTEVPNAAFSIYAEMERATGIFMPEYAGSDYLREAGERTKPVSGLTWGEARSYCRFLGKELPTTDQWQKAMRGGLTLASGEPNPMPRRNLPWGKPVSPAPAKLGDTGAPGPAPVGSFPGDRSPYGVLDLAGNVQEWTGSLPSSQGRPVRGFRITRGANWDPEATSALLVTYMAVPNARPVGNRIFVLGMRCARE